MHHLFETREAAETERKAKERGGNPQPPEQPLITQKKENNVICAKIAIIEIFA